MVDKISAITRVKKLLEFNEHNNATQEEIDTAARMIGRILADNNLSLEDVDQHVIDSDTISCNADTDYVTVPAWMCALSYNVAVALDCKCILDYWIDIKENSPLRRKLKRRLVFIGHKQDAEVAAYLYSFLEKELWRLSGESADKELRSGLSDRMRYRNNFIMAAANSIRAKLESEKPQRNPTATGSTSLMVVKANAVAKKVKELYPRLTSHKAPDVYGDHEAYQNGKEAGANLSIRRGVKTSSETKFLTA